ncbi:RNA polymerase sigma-I factor [Zhaonella formicivorans]|uniref:RNA polymerase sigma-I factor n=1 Tax=Zhaonella formicivorans TaxID=2528593 RepID=UPI001D110B82|nr:RNA polymerase sigma-I factor [Zhaonella formicivorans]
MQLLAEAKAGSELAREQLLLSYKGRIASIVNSICGKTLNWANDDELSIGLIAFNEAIDSYDAAKGKSFLNYAQLVIHNRLVDYFRKEARFKNVTMPMVDETEQTKQEAEEAWEQFRQEEEAREQAEMVANFQQALLEFNIPLNALVKDSPKHQDTKRNLMQVAAAVTENAALLERLLATKQLPIKELMYITGQSRKVLESGRRYIIALVLILTREEFLPMRALIQFPDKGR